MLVVAVEFATLTLDANKKPKAKIYKPSEIDALLQKHGLGKKDEDAEMDVDDDEEPTSAKKRAKTNSGAVVAKRAPRANRQAAGLRDEEQAKRANKLRNFDQRPRNYMAKAGEADRKIQTKMPKHLFAGKRKMGKTDRR